MSDDETKEDIDLLKKQVHALAERVTATETLLSEVKVPCKCGSDGTLGFCPYSSEINGTDRACTCCSGCRHQCAMDI